MPRKGAYVRKTNRRAHRSRLALVLGALDMAEARTCLQLAALTGLDYKAVNAVLATAIRRGQAIRTQISITHRKQGGASVAYTYRAAPPERGQA